MSGCLPDCLLLWPCCCALHQARAPLNDLSRVTASDLFADTPVSQQPILKQLVQRILRGEELPDLSQASYWYFAATYRKH